MESTEDWQLRSIPAKPPYLDPEEGRVCIPFRLLKDGTHNADVILRLTPNEAQDFQRNLLGAVYQAILASLDQAARSISLAEAVAASDIGGGTPSA